MRINTVGVYWSARRESAEACAGRLSKYLLSIKSAFPELADWYRKCGGASQAISLDQNNNGELLDLLTAGTNRRDLNGEVIEELGFRVGLWNKRKESEGVGLGITCGLFSNSTGLSNTVTLSLPQDLDVLSLQGSEALKKLLLLQVEAWSPDWGAVFASQGDALKSRNGNGPFFDQMLWLKSAVSLPEGVDKGCPGEIALGGTIYIK